MAYTKTNWINGVTPLSADNMNKIEQGIYDNSIKTHLYKHAPYADDTLGLIIFSTLSTPISSMIDIITMSNNGEIVNILVSEDNAYNQVLSFIEGESNVEFYYLSGGSITHSDVDRTFQYDGDVVTPF